MFIRIGNLVLNTDNIISIDLDSSNKYHGYAPELEESLKDTLCVQITTSEFTSEFGYGYEGTGSGENRAYFFYGTTAKLIAEFFSQQAEVVAIEVETPECFKPLPTLEVSAEASMSPDDRPF